MKSKQKEPIQKLRESKKDTADIEAEFLKGSIDMRELLKDLVACRMKEKYEN